MDASATVKKRVSIVFTGGTISMGFDPVAGGPVPMFSGAEIIARVPGLEDYAEIRSIDFARLPGPHMTPGRMLELAGRIQTELDDASVDGAVVTHGTDTLEETAYLLDLVLTSAKPVILVGSMRNSADLGWDGPANLRAAVRVAADPQARELGVLVVMNDQLLAATEATKTHVEALETFQSRDFGPVGFLDKDRLMVLHRRVVREHIPAARVEENVEIIKLSAGSDGTLVRSAVQAGMRGLILESLGRGNVPVTAIGAVEQALGSGLPVVITSRCPRGRILDTYAYEGSGKHLKRLGAILGGLLPSHKARIKLMLLLGGGSDLARIRASFAS
jgi:L-asparaginase